MREQAMKSGLGTTVGTVLVALVLALPLASAQSSGVTPTNTWLDVYSSHSSFAGVPIPAGSYVAVFDPQGTLCGERTASTPGYVAPVMPCYGDDSRTSVDEGAVENDLLVFSVNGTLATPQARARNFQPVPPHTPVTWHALDVWEVDLVVPPQPDVHITHEAEETVLSWQPAQATVSMYEVWRSELPHFIPGDGQSEGAATLPAETVPLEWSGSAGAGNTLLNYAYRVVSLDETSQMVGVSQAVGEFDFELHRGD